MILFCNSKPVRAIRDDSILLFCCSVRSSCLFKKARKAHISAPTSKTKQNHRYTLNFFKTEKKT